MSEIGKLADKNILDKNTLKRKVVLHYDKSSYYKPNVQKRAQSSFVS